MLETKKLKWFNWEMSIDIDVVLLTQAWMIWVYYLASKTAYLGMSLPVLIMHILINVVLPIVWIIYIRKNSPEDLGITRNNLRASIIISLIFSTIVFIIFRPQVVNTQNLHFLMLYNALALWEPFFLFGWLQLRFDKAFGIIPGILLTALCFAAYHIGIYPIANLSVLLISGVLLASIFRYTMNIIVMWPLTWAFMSIVKAMIGNSPILISDLSMIIAALTIQMGLIILIVLRRQDRL